MVVVGGFRFDPIFPAVHEFNPVHAGLGRLKLRFENGIIFYLVVFNGVQFHV